MLDEDRLATATASKTRALNKSKKLQATEKLIRETASKDAELKELRRLNRIRFDKWQEGIDRGYNPIDLSVVDVTNPTTALRIFPAPKRPATVWDKLQAPVGYGSRPVTSVSARDISNGSQSKQNEIPASPIAASARSSRSVLSSARSNPVEMGGSSSRRSVTANALPQLNLNKVEPPPAVTYSDSNVNGPPGQPIAMVRTGGFSGLK